MQNSLGGGGANPFSAIRLLDTRKVYMHAISPNVTTFLLTKPNVLFVSLIILFMLVF